jgi:hypothetical protein
MVDASGVPCACGEGDWQKRPPATRRVGGCDDTSGRFAEVTVETCSACGAHWLDYFWEDHHDNGIRCRGLVAAEVAHQVTAANAADTLAALPWYWRSGTYHDGRIFRDSGSVER